MNGRLGEHLALGDTRLPYYVLRRCLFNFPGRIVHITLVQMLFLEWEIILGLAYFSGVWYLRKSIDVQLTIFLKLGAFSAFSNTVYLGLYLPTSGGSVLSHYRLEVSHLQVGGLWSILTHF